MEISKFEQDLKRGKVRVISDSSFRIVHDSETSLEERERARRGSEWALFFLFFCLQIYCFFSISSFG